MQISVASGTYVVAVSGGVDSMVLLDLLTKRAKSVKHQAINRSQTAQSPKPLKLIVVHYDHGLRKDSERDRKFVQQLAKKHQLPFVYENGQLGKTTNEAAARSARYMYLHNVVRATGAKAVITAHHQDDVLETAIINLLRGTGRRGLTSLKSTDKIVRPLLGYSKEQLRDYAAHNSVEWREDLTNQDTKFTRNQVRHTILPRFMAGQRAQLLILLDDMKSVNEKLDASMINLLHTQPALNELNKKWFIMLPHDITCEVVHSWLSRCGIKNITRRTIDRLIVDMKTGKNGQNTDVDRNYILQVKPYVLALIPRDR